MDYRVAAFVHYYAREGYAHHLQAVCNEVIKQQHGGGASAALQFWRAYGLLAAGATGEAMRELQELRAHPDIGPAAAAALLTAHQSANVTDHDAIMQLSAQLQVEEPTVSGPAALNLAAYLFYTHSFERARTILERQLQAQQDVQQPWSSADDAALRALLGFVLLQQQAQEVPALQDVQELRAALQLFDSVLQRDPSDLQALLGKARTLEATHDLRGAWELLSEASVRLPWAVPVLVELCRLTLAQQDWDSLADVLARLRQVDCSNTTALAYTALSALLVDGSTKAANQHFAELCGQVQEGERRNVALMAHLAGAFARVAGSDAGLLVGALELLGKVEQLQPDNIDLVVERAAQQLLMDQPAAAMEGFEAALRLDELNMPAMLGLIEAQLAADRLDEAAQQLQFLPELLAASRAAASLGGAGGPAWGSSSGSGKTPFGFAASVWRLSGKQAAASSSNGGDGSAAGLQVVAGRVSEVEQVHEHEPLLLYLRGLLAWKQGRQPEGLQQLQQWVELHLEAVDELPFGLELLGQVNLSRILGLLRLLLASVGGDPRLPSDPPAPVLGQCMRVLEMLSRFCFSHPEAQLLGARALYLNGALEAAARKAADILRTNSDSVQAALLIVSVHVRQGRPADAMAALEAAVSANFSIREAPLYHVVHAQVLLANGRLEDAKKVLEAALALPGVRTPPTPEQAARLARRGCLPSLYERAQIYLLLADVCSKLSKTPDSAEARKHLAEAVRKFTGTREEVNVMIADCEAAIAGGDMAGALQRLRRVPESSQQYCRARVAMANIHLKHQQDKAAYIQCYLDLVDKSPDYDTYCLLAEAFMSIQEPDRAAQAYESAMALRPKDADLALAAAQALTTAHDYNRAIDYYNRAIRNDPSKLVLQHGLDRLLLKLGQTRQATLLLDKCLETHKARGQPGSLKNLETLALDVDTWLLLAKLQHKSCDAEGFIAAQNQALELQCSLLEQLRDPGMSAAAAAAAATSAGSASPGSPGSKRKASKAAADGFAGLGSSLAAVGSLNTAAVKAGIICFDLAEFYRKKRQLDKAEAAYTACLSHHPKHGVARLALARLALANGQIDACQSHASALLEDQPDNEDAAIMLAELMTHQDNSESAVFYFQQLLERKPCHFTALVQMLGLLRRAGRLGEAGKFIAAAEAASTAGSAGSAADSSSTASGDGGLHYCKGLLNRWQGSPREALKNLNLARRDPKWSAAAILGMAEVYLGPGADISWASEGGERDDDAAAAKPDETCEAIKAAGTLLQQLRPADMESNKYKVLTAYTLMATKHKSDIEAAVGQLLDVANADPNNVPVLLALARGFLLLRQTAKARNQLKRVSKLPYRPEDADEFEQAWLGLADIHIAGGKFDMAQELCTRCLRYNKSCSRAWEVLGSVAERQQAYKEAVGQYEHAWELANKADPAIGYKLSFNYMKAGRLVEAISVAQAVLAADPAYPLIRHDVLDKARAGLRP